MTTLISNFKITKSELKKISDDPNNYGNTMNIQELKNLLVYAKDKYYNDKEIFDDYVFDTLEDILRTKSPNNPYFKMIGAPILKSTSKVKLPYNLGSMDKIKPNTKELSRYLTNFKGPYCISEKLDGLSGLLVYNHNDTKNTSLFKRGDGKYATDISHLIPYLNLPEINVKLAVRGEFIISKKIFKKKYKDKFPKIRSFVAGLVNAKKPNIELLKDLEFITYELIYPENIKPSDQFDLLKKMKFNVVKHKIVDSLNTDILSQILINTKKNTEYSIDGIIVANNTKYKRVSEGNPKHAVAFKMNLDEYGNEISQGQETIVKDVIWNPSKYGTLKPQIQIETVIIDGDNVNFITGNNAKYIKENGIGPGAKITVIKSGDVIPKVFKVLKKVEPKFPKNIKWHWNSSRVEIIIDEIVSNKEVIVKKLLNFFTVLNIPNISTGILTKLVNNNFATIKAICQMDIGDFMSLPGIKDKSANKLYNSIHNIMDKEIEIHTLMSASGIFGHGFAEKKLLPVIKTYPNILKDYKKINKSDLLKIEGYSDITIDKFLKKIPDFVKFINEHKFIKIKKFEEKKNKNGKYKGEKILFSGVRNKDLEEYIVKNGGEIVNTISNKVSLLIVKDVNSSSSKINKAKELNIKIIGIDNFKK